MKRLGHRKGFALARGPSEAIAMKKLIEGKFKAKARQSAAGGDVSQKRNACADIYTSGKTREKIAQAIGIGSPRVEVRPATPISP